MKLISLKLENFRQHRDTWIDFPEGITGIIGPNGAGKSTLLEAIAWSIYGQRANQRDKARDILWQRAGAKATVRVEVAFELNGQRYRVVRDPRNAELHQEGKDTPIVTGLTDVTHYLEERLGMDYRAFFNSYFTRQKELAFLANESVADRQKLINKMLGLEALEKARRNINADRLGFQRQIEGMEKGLPDLEELLAQQEGVKEAISRAEGTWHEANDAVKRWESEYATLQPRWQESQRRADQARDWQAGLELGHRECQHRQQEVAKLTAKLKELSACGEELLRLQPNLDRWEAIQPRYREQEELQRFEGRRQKLAGQLAALDDRAVEQRTEADQLARVLESEALARGRQAVSLANQQVDELARRIYQQDVAWREERAALESDLKSRRQERGRVVKRREVIARGGESGSCPTCLRPITDSELPPVLDNLATQLAEIDGSIEQLSGQLLRCQATARELQERQAELEGGRRRLEELKKVQIDLETGHAYWQKLMEAMKLAAEERQRVACAMGQLPQGFAAELWESLVGERKQLEPVKRREAELRERLKDRPTAEQKLSEAEKALHKAHNDARQLKTLLSDLNFAPEQHLRLEQELQVLAERCLKGREVLAERQGSLQKQRGRLEELLRQETELRAKQSILEDLRREHRYLVVLEDHLEKLRAELNGRIRPELEAAASQFLEQLTDGRYRSLELDENYGIRLVDDGDSFPLQRFSGGECDIAHLCLRLAISEMIVQRAGQPLSLMVLDEIFGSLDETRRDNLMNLLESLNRRFSQIILITHIEDVRQTVERLIRVSFDEKTGASYVEVEPGRELSEAIYA